MWYLIKFFETFFIQPNKANCHHSNCIFKGEWSHTSIDFIYNWNMLIWKELFIQQHFGLYKLIHHDIVVRLRVWIFLSVYESLICFKHIVCIFVSFIMESSTIKPYNESQSKKEQIEKMFDGIAPTYDFFQSFLSLGIDIGWRKSHCRCW